MAPFGWAASLQKCKVIATLSYYGFRLVSASRVSANAPDCSVCALIFATILSIMSFVWLTGL